MCYRFRIISEIRSINEFSSREMKTPAIRMNTKMLNAFVLFSRKRNNEMMELVGFYYISVWQHLQTLYQSCAWALNQTHHP